MAADAIDADHDQGDTQPRNVPDPGDLEPTHAEAEQQRVDERRWYAPGSAAYPRRAIAPLGGLEQLHQVQVLDLWNERRHLLPDRWEQMVEVVARAGGGETTLAAMPVPVSTDAKVVPLRAATRRRLGIGLLIERVKPPGTPPGALP